MIDLARRRSIEHALVANDIARAATLAQAAIAAGETGPLLLNLAAWASEEAGDFATADALHQRALVQSPRDPAIVTAIGSVRRKSGMLDQALRLFDAAIAIAPAFAVPWLERGFALDAGGAAVAARQSYARAAVLDPGCAPAFAGVAAMAAREGDHVAARDYAMRSLALDPNEPTASAALAVVELAEGDAAGATTRARRMLGQNNLPPEYRIAALTLLGDALDQLNTPAAAFAAYAEAQRATATLHAHRFTTQPSHRAFVEHLTGAVDMVAASPPPAIRPVADEAARHVFLLGYPRSGTTLVENILASVPEVEALEERPTLAAADAAFFTGDDGLAHLAALDDEAAATYRAAYWRKVAACGVDVRGKTFVDMDPLKGIKLPAIARLFPDAHIVVMLRDPRDVVLSCFRCNFRMSAAAMEFTSLERTARHYDAVMTLIDRSIESLPIRVHKVRYDDLVVDFDRVTGELCDRIGVRWSPAMRDFDRTAARRGTATASATQVRRGLYNGSGQWRRYHAELEPVLPVLEPWVRRFGYPA